MSHPSRTPDERPRSDIPPGPSASNVDLPTGSAATTPNRRMKDEIPVDKDLGTPSKSSVTRIGMIWVATVVGLILLVLLIVFIAQNQDQVTLHYFGFTGQVNLGLALFIASVAGGLVTAVAAASRIVQLRAKSNKQRKARTRQ